VLVQLNWKKRTCDNDDDDDDDDDEDDDHKMPRRAQILKIDLVS